MTYAQTRKENTEVSMWDSIQKTDETANNAMGLGALGTGIGVVALITVLMMMFFPMDNSRHVSHLTNKVSCLEDRDAVIDSMYVDGKMIYMCKTPLNDGWFITHKWIF